MPLIATTTRKAALRGELLLVFYLAIKLLNLTTLNGIGFTVVLHFSFLIEVHFTLLNVPGSILVAGNTGESKVDLGTLHFPPAILVLEDSIFLERDFTIGSLPPTKTILINTLCIEVYLGVLNSPPAKIVLEDTSFFEVNNTVGGFPPAILVLIDAIGILGEHPVYKDHPLVCFLIIINGGLVEIDISIFDQESSTV